MVKCPCKELSLSSVMISSYLRQYYCHEIKILTDKPGTTVLEERGERLKQKRKVQREEKGYEEIFC